MRDVDVVILGAGAAGMFCAAEAARRGRRVVVLDHARNPGEKIRISGGGRCNFTNRSIAPERFLSANPRFALSALNRFTPQDFIARIDRAGIAWHEKTLGQLFCDGSATQVVAMLAGDLRSAGADLELGVTVGSIVRGERFLVETDRGGYRAERLVVATGGLSIPKMGATGLGYRIAAQFGLSVVETRPGLVPFTFSGDDLAGMAALSGVSVGATVATAKARFSEGLLFTHRGLSGPSVLQSSSYWREGQEVTVDLAAAGPDAGVTLREARGTRGKAGVARVLAGLMPERVAEAALARAGVAGIIAELSNRDIERISAAVHRWQILPSGTEGYRTAEVTLGGVDTRGLDARTMEARKVPGLHFVGEVVDVTGWLGGYNLQWAWSSGWAAGQAV